MKGLNIAWYGIIIATGIVLGVWVALTEAKRKGYTSELLFDFLILALPLAIVCARIYYVATYFEVDPATGERIFTYWNYLKEGNLYEVFAIWKGGIAIYGAVIGGVIAALILGKWRKFPVLQAAWISARRADARTGNRAVGKFYEPGSVRKPDYQSESSVFSIRRIYPTAGRMAPGNIFYESMWDFGVFIWLLFYARKAKYDGNVIAMYFIAYGIGRFFIEGMRTDSLWIGPFRISQLLSVIFIAGGLIYILVRRKIKKPDPVYEGRYLRPELKTEEE